MLQGPCWEKARSSPSPQEWQDPNCSYLIQLFSTDKHLWCVDGLCWAWELWSVCYYFFEFLETGFDFFFLASKNSCEDLLECYVNITWDMGTSAYLRCDRWGQRVFRCEQTVYWLVFFPANWRYLERRNFSWRIFSTHEHVSGTFSWLLVDVEGTCPLQVVPSLGGISGLYKKGQ